jgi:hypothetical protein
MIIKLCFNNEIHRVSQLPSSFKALNEVVKSVFKNTLPPVYALQYDDVDGDRIMLSGDEDFKAMTESNLPNSKKTMKVYISALDESFISLKKDVSIISKSDTSENYQVIDSPKLNESPILQSQSSIKETQATEKACSEISMEKSQPEKLTKCKKQKKEKKDKTKKKQQIKAMINDSLYENIANIALLVKDYLSEPSIELPKAPKLDAKNIHYRITCDGCGVNPLIGARYKCAVCNDFDYCEKCEATIDHPHPFLKIKNPAHHPRALCVMFDENMPGEFDPNVFSQENKSEGSGSFASMVAENYQNLSGNTRSSLNSIFGGLPEKIIQKFMPKEEPVTQPEKKEEKIEIPKPQEVPVQKIQEIEIKPQVPKLDFAFIKEISTIPSKIGIKDLVVYKTISLKNTGSCEWPKSTFLTSVNEVKGQQAKLIHLAPGKEMSAILIIDSPCRAGKFISAWRLAHINEKNETIFIGEPFSVNFEIDQPVEQIKKEEPKKEEPKKEFPEKIKQLALQMKDIFPEADMNTLLEFISNTPDLPLEELVDSYLG